MEKQLHSSPSTERSKETRLHLLILETKTNNETNFNYQQPFSFKNGGKIGTDFWRTEKIKAK